MKSIPKFIYVNIEIVLKFIDTIVLNATFNNIKNMLLYFGKYFT